MKIKKTIKRIMALGTGLTLLGATVFGAVATNLGDYPYENFVRDGKFHGLLVVGASASTDDVLGVVDIATSLQYSTRIERAVDGTTTTTLTGDVYKFQTNSDVLSMTEMLSDIKTTLTEDDLGVLKATNMRTAKGTTEVNQRLRFGTSGLQAVYDLNREADVEVVGDFLYVDGGDVIFTYDVQFISGLESDIENDEWKHFQDREIYMLGTGFTIVSAKNTSNAANPDMEITLMTGSLTDTLQAGDTKTYSVDGQDFEVSVLIIAAADANRGDNARTKLMVNGEITDTLEEGDTYTLNDGTVIGVRDILAGGSGAGKTDLLSFYIGAEKMVLSGDSAVDTSVEVNDERIDDLTVGISASKDASTGVLNTLSFELRADDPIYLAEGEQISDYIADKEGMIAPTWDIVYAGLTKPATTEVVLRPSSARAYRLDFTNQEGISYTLPLVEYDRIEEEVVIGSRRKHLILAATDTLVKDNMFIVNGDNDDTSNTRVFEVANIKADNDHAKGEVEVRDIATGSVTKLRWLNEITSGTCNETTSALTAGGEEYVVEVCRDGNDYTLSVPDMTNIITVRHGVTIELNDDANILNLVFTIDDSYTDSGLDESFNVSVRMSSSEPDELDITRFANIANSELSRNSDEGSDDSKGMTRYGIKLYQRDSDKADTLTVTIPSEQVSYNVYVTGSDVSAQTTSVGAGATYGEVQRIEVGKAVLDTEVRNVAADNLIVVGGPCANTVAATLLGIPNSRPACFEDFPVPEGQGIIQMVENGNNVAIVVAGYSAADTRNAAQILARYDDYAEELEGKSEVVVSGTRVMAVEVQPEAPAAPEMDDDADDADEE